MPINDYKRALHFDLCCDRENPLHTTQIQGPLFLEFNSKIKLEDQLF